MMFLSILWHMHQPYYVDADTGEINCSTMVFRSLFNYYPMALISSEHPDVKLNFNLTPVLIKQIEGISSGSLKDNFLHMLKIDDVSAEQLHLFLQEVPDFALRRYKVINILREKLANNSFSSRDLFDLKIYLHLASFHPMLIDEELEEFFKKGRGFDLKDQGYLYAKILGIFKEILPLYKELQDRQQVEISTSPLMHPIMPLLFNTDNALKTKTALSVPGGLFSYPEDAKMQLAEGMEVYKNTFGVIPKGIWPSEGSLSDEVLELFSESGILWTATDEYLLAETLARPLKDEHYNIWDFRDRNLSLFFRDHVISDLIGFSYQEKEEEKAAADLIGRLEAIGENNKERIVTIILDGENPWDFYPKYGQKFLSSLYGLVGSSGEIKSLTFDKALEENIEHKKLERISPGSWMGNNFDNWIGQKPANKAWQILGKAREQAASALQRMPEDRKRLLVESIMIAESSDWFWWYSLPAGIDTKIKFDSYFRNSIRRVYETSGIEPPEFLCLPVEDYEGEEIIPYIQPIIDGRITHFYEWYNAVKVEPQNLWGTFKPVDFPVEKIFYGYDENNVYIRMDFKSGEDMEIQIIFHNSDEKTFQIDTAAKNIAGPLYFKKGEIIEIQVPREKILHQNEKKLYFNIKASKNGQQYKIPSSDYFKITFKEKEYWIV